MLDWFLGSLRRISRAGGGPRGGGRFGQSHRARPGKWHRAGQSDFVRRQFDNFDLTAAYAATFLLAMLALSTLVAMNFLKRKEDS